MTTMQPQPFRLVEDLTDPSESFITNMSFEQAQQCVASGDTSALADIEGAFALVGRDGESVRMARTLAIPLRYFIAKLVDGPALVVAHRIDQIRDWLTQRGLSSQFHPSYTRMVPAHHITQVRLVGCPDPNPTYDRFFAPQRNALPGDLAEIGHRYMEATARGIDAWLNAMDDHAPVGVCFSGGIDSGAILLLTYHVMRQRGMNLGRLKAFTLNVDGNGADCEQAREFLEALDLEYLLETIDVSSDAIHYQEAVRLIEDYKPLDIQAGTLLLALCRGVRERYADWKYLLDGDGGDENLKDYPIEENDELTVRSVLNNRMLYQEGWGVDAIKHSLTFSGGLSRACTRSFAPTRALGFSTLSPFMLPSVVSVAEGIPFIDLTDWDHDRLYDLKGQVVSRGIESVTGLQMPVFPKRRFQHGATAIDGRPEFLPESELPYRQAFAAAFDG